MVLTGYARCLEPVPFGVDGLVKRGNLFGLNVARPDPDAATTADHPCAWPNGGDGQLQQRLAAKQQWKAAPGHRYTPQELQCMSTAADLTIRRRKRVVMQL